MLNLIGELKKIGKLKKNCHKNKSECTVVGLGPLLPSIKRVHLYVKLKQNEKKMNECHMNDKKTKLNNLSKKKNRYIFHEPSILHISLDCILLVKQCLYCQPFYWKTSLK